MRRERLRDPGGTAMYLSPHDHRIFGRGHYLRIELSKVLCWELRGSRVADLSCGNGLLAQSLKAEETVLGDLAPGWPVTGPIEETVAVLDPVDLFICSETAEHVDDPDALLAAIRARSRRLFLSTPVEAWGDANGEHVWCWDREAVEAMLTGAGWTVDVFAELDSTVFGEPYRYGMWGCR